MRTHKPVFEICVMRFSHFYELVNVSEDESILRPLWEGNQGQFDHLLSFFHNGGNWSWHPPLSALFNNSVSSPGALV